MGVFPIVYFRMSVITVMSTSYQSENEAKKDSEFVIMEIMLSTDERDSSNHPIDSKAQ